MRSKDIEFPVYRKYKNGKSYFKIINPKLFEEIQVIGKRRIHKRIEALQFPEQRFVNDLIHSFTEMAVEISAAEWQEQLELL